MNLEELRERVFSEFGPDLRRASPATVNEFLARLQQEDFDGSVRGPIELEEGEPSYEGIIKQFLVGALTRPAAQAIVPLWVFAFQLAFAMVEQHEGERLQLLDGSGA